MIFMGRDGNVGVTQPMLYFKASSCLIKITYYKSDAVLFHRRKKVQVRVLLQKNQRTLSVVSTSQAKNQSPQTAQSC